MVESLPILQGYYTLQLWRKTGGCNRWPNSIIWEICGNTLVDEISFQCFSQFRWLKNPDNYAYRTVLGINGQAKLTVFLAREILGLSRTPGKNGDIADHRNHDTVDNTLENLRIASPQQSVRNIRSYNKLRFKGIRTHKYGYDATICFNGVSACFSPVSRDIEAGLMYWYADIILNDEFAYPTIFPADEMPNEERQQELWEMVIEKLRQKGLLCA